MGGKEMGKEMGTLLIVADAENWEITDVMATKKMGTLLIFCPPREARG